jgi:hypothetical protein
VIVDQEPSYGVHAAQVGLQNDLKYDSVLHRSEERRNSPDNPDDDPNIPRRLHNVIDLHA